jgi:hypothetical protein
MKRTEVVRSEQIRKLTPKRKYASSSIKNKDVKISHSVYSYTRKWRSATTDLIVQSSGVYLTTKPTVS